MQSQGIQEKIKALSMQYAEGVMGVKKDEKRITDRKGDILFGIGVLAAVVGTAAFVIAMTGWFM